MSSYNQNKKYNFINQLIHTPPALMLCVALLVMLLPSAVTYAAAPVVNTTIAVNSTGTFPFDGSTWDGNPANAGMDANDTNNVVRLQDIVTYVVEVSVNDTDVGDLTSTVQLDKKQAWVSIPTGCKTAMADVTAGPVSSISTDGRTLFCNLGPSIEGTTKTFYPSARAIGVSYDGTEITINDDLISATVTAEADPTTNPSNVATGGPVETIVTANFRVDTIKEPKNNGTDPDSGAWLYQAEAKPGPNGEGGYLMQFRISTRYMPGSMVADSGEAANGFEADYDLFDYFTDSHLYNDPPTTTVSSGGILYTWDPSIPGCYLDGNHGVNATVNCTQNNISGDFTSPSSSNGFIADGLNDPNVDIDLNNIDVRDPDNDGNLIELVIGFWFETATEIEGHQSCTGGGRCDNQVLNEVGTYDAINNQAVGFNPLSTEDASGNRLTNYNSNGEPFPNNVDLGLHKSTPGGYSVMKSFKATTWNTNPTKSAEQYVAAGATLPFFNNVWDYRQYDGGTTQLCDKIDTTVYEYVGIANSPDPSLVYGFNVHPENPAMFLWGGTESTKRYDGTPYVEILYSDKPHALGPTVPTPQSTAYLEAMRDETCEDDLNGDSIVNIMDANGVQSAPGNPVDWYMDSSMVPGGPAAVTKIRNQATYVKADMLALYPTHKNWAMAFNHAVKVKSITDGYGSNDYLPNFMTYRRDDGYGTNFRTWVSSPNAVDDVEHLDFGYHGAYADRNILVPSGHGIAKRTEPAGIKIVKGGDIVDYILTPQVYGLWDETTTNTARVHDNLPVGVNYIVNSEMFSVNGGTTWMSRAAYDASNPAITITSSPHAGGADPLIWDFGSVQPTEQLPMIRYKIQVDPTRVSGTFKNAAQIISDMGVDGPDDNDVADPVFAYYQIEILPESGLDVKKSVDHPIYEVNQPFEFNLFYKNLGATDYSDAEFIDILPYVNDGSGAAGGLASTRDPSSNYNGIFELTKITRSNSEVFYATDAAPNTIQADPCHEANQPPGYVPASGDLCYKFYTTAIGAPSNKAANTFAGGSASGTGATTWTACSSLNPLTCGALNNVDITAIRFVVPSMTAASGGHKVSITLDPTGNVGGDPDIDADNHATGASTGDLYTNNLSGRVEQISLLVISNDVSVTVVEGTIGDTVWWDEDRDGHGPAGAGNGSDTNEPPIPGATVELLDSLGNPIYVDPVTGGIVPSSWPGAIPYTTVTDSNGQYLFENLPSGDYQVRVTPPVGAFQTYDSDGVGTSNISSLTLGATTDPSGNILDVNDDEAQDFGYVKLYDLALQKTVQMPLPNPLLPNGKITFDLVIHNQASPVQEIDVIEYIDNTMWDAFDVTDNPNGTVNGTTASMAYSWTGGGTYAPVLKLTGIISGNDSVVVPVTLSIKTPMSGSLADLENKAEISRFDNDTNPANGDSSQAGTGSQLVDEDSTPDATDSDTVKDDVINEDGKNNAGEDEDDHDIALVPIYDLALTKERSAGQGYTADFSTNPPTASFDITVKNQGNQDVTDVMVADYVPTGMSIQSATVPIVGGTNFDVGAIPAGGSVTFTVVMAINDLSQGTYVNGAEISAMSDSAGNPVTDVDSLMDSIDGNDPINTFTGIDPNGEDDNNSHNDIDYDRTAGGDLVDTTSNNVAPDQRDEDDHDQEVIVAGLALGNRVWYDEDNNGTINGAGSGIENVVVEVYAVDNLGNPVGVPITTTTDANGYWLVDNLPPGDYMAVIPASNFIPGAPLADHFSSSDIATSADPENGQESDDNGIGTTPSGGISSGVITLDVAAGEPLQSGTEGDPGPMQGQAGDALDNLTVDFGFYQADFGDAPDSYDTTLASGGASHTLDGVTFLGSGVDAEMDGNATMNADGDDNIQDDEDGVTFLTPIMAGEPFTIEVEASTDGYLNTWIDFNGDGTFDPGEQISSDQPLTAGVNTLTFTAPGTVDDDNLYSRFRFTADPGEVTGPGGQASTGEVEDYVLMSLGDTIWHDNGAGSTGGADANNGIQDGTEAGIPNVVVELIDGNGNVVATTTTNANGEYLFTGLVPGDYTVHLPASNFADGAPLEDHFSSSGADTGDTVDNNDNGLGDGYSDPVTDGISSSPVNLSPDAEPTNDGDGGHSNRTVDFGLVQYDKGDLPDTAAGEGPGDYETLTTGGHDGAMHVIVPDVFLGSSVDAETNGQPDADADGDNNADSNDEDGVVFTSLILPGQNATVDVTANVDGFLNAWVDFNGDGDFDDPGEQISSDQPLTAGTNNLTYPVPAGMLASDLHTRFRFTSDDPAGALGPNGAWDNGEVEDYMLNGLSLGNQIWHDLDNDGAKDTSELGLDGVVVNLIDPATGTVIMTDTTSNGGYYIFDNLLSGDPAHQDVSSDYIVEVDASNFAPGGPLEDMYNSTPTEADPNADMDLNDNGITPVGTTPQVPATSYPPTAIQSGVVTLTDDGEPTTESDYGPNGHGNAEDESSNLSVDFGFYLPVTVGDTVFYDHDQDGLQAGTATEPGVPGIDVTLYDSVTGQPVLDGAGNPMTTTTDANGNYIFEELPPGRYHVEFDLNDLPQNYVVTTPHVGSDISSDSNANPSTGATDSTPFLYSGAQDMTLDMGIMLLEDVRIGDRVWFDDNQDGIQDIGETGVPSITVTLYDNVTGQPMLDAAGNPMTTMTDAGGNYLFDELPPGDYYVQFDLSTLPANYFVTAQDAGGDDTMDSDADPSTGVTAPTGPLNSGEQDLSLDMGIYRLDNVEIGDTVWFDDNRDGVQDPGEGGVENVGVTLYDTATGQPVVDDAGNPITTMTDANGEYLFTDLPPGDYYVVFDLSSLPQDYMPTQQNAGSDDTADSDADRTTGATDPTGMLNSNDSDLSLDMGIHINEDVMIGDTVWFDNDKDGVQDAGEPGVPGVGVMLYDATTGQPVTDASGNPLTTTTDANGNYLFDNLPPGDYFVQFDLGSLPPNYKPTIPNVGGDATDSDADPTTGQTPSTGMLHSGDADLSLDMGIQPNDNIVVGDRVWFDDNRDGIQDAGEAGVPGVLAMLYDTATGQPVTDQFGVPMIDLTDSNGEYLFENLPPGDYYVEFQLSTLPADHVVTQPNQGGDDTMDSDADPSTGRTGTTGYLQSDEEDRTLDMGIYRPEAVRVGDRVWLDNDRDGVQDGNEVGVPGVTVTLVDSAGNPVTQDRDGNPIAPQVTDANGNYLFDNLPDGDYGVVFDLTTIPGNHAVSQPDQGSDDLLDSDVDPVTGATPSTGPLTSGDEDMSLDMGIYPLSEVQVGDTVWFDNDADGIQDPSEQGVPGVVVNIFNADGSTVTDMAGNSVGFTATDANGNYLFENLPPGDYYVEFDLTSLPAGHLVTAPDVAGDDTVDSDADPTSGQTSSTGPLADGDADLSLDMGIFQPASLGDTVWEDINSDGVQDAGEPGIAGVTVTLYNADGSPAVDLNGNTMTTTTDSNGNYRFDNLLPGDYYVEFMTPVDYTPSPQDSGGNDSEDSDADPITGQTAVTTLTSGENDTTWDAGFYQTLTESPPTLDGVSVGNRAWYDDDRDGIQDPGETGVAGVIVELFNADGTSVTDLNGEPVGSVTTDANGNYLFDNLPAGDYYVQFSLSDLPADSVVTTPDAGSDDGADSDADPTTGATATTGPLAAGEEDLSLDMGIYRPASLGDTVWEDLDGDGVQDAGEPGIEGVTVTLFNADGTPATDMNGNPATATTDANGNYLFDDLYPGDYYVEFTAPSGYTPSPQDAGSDDSEDSDADPITGQTAVTTLSSGENDTTWDAGFYQPDPDTVRIGNRVWYDDNLDGIQDAGEDGVEGVTVNLFNADGSAVTDPAGNPVTTVTDANGNYLFDNLPPGDYYVQFNLGDLPAGSMVTMQDAGSDDAADSDADPATGETAPTGDLAAGEEDMTLDMGIYRPASLGDRVWEDLDGDGIQDAGEPGIEGVTVTLFNADGTPATDINGEPVTTMTDANGNYLFDDLYPGDYYVEFTAPAGYDPSPQDAGSDDSADSDADPITGQTAVTTLASGENDTTWDAGFYPSDPEATPPPEPTSEVTPVPATPTPEPASVGDLVWYDNDGDGVQDPGEPGVEGVTVTLYNADGTLVTDLAGEPVGPVETDANGEYLFDNLPAGEYYVTFNLGDLPEGYQPTAQNASGDEATDSDGDPVTGQTGTTGPLGPGDMDNTLDLGIVAPVSVGNNVWYDNNGDGIQDADESGVEDVRVVLLNANGTPATHMDGSPVEPIETDSDGNYLFENLPPGDYQVMFELDTIPANYMVTQQDSGSDDAQDSDADPATGLTAPTGMLLAGDEDMTLDMGIVPVPPVTIGDQVWEDTNGNGIQDAGEPGVEGVTVMLTNADGTPVVDLAGEPVAPVTTDSNGNYLFDNLPPGDYVVQFVPPAGYTITNPDSGSDDGADSDANPNTGQTAPTGFLPGGTVIDNLDMGLVPPQPVAVGNRVWYDNDGDGVQDSPADEPGVADVEVILFNADGTSVTDMDGNLVEPIRTDANGEYRFDNLPAGDYFVQYNLATLPQHYVVTEAHAGSDDGVDSDANTSTGETSTTGFIPGGSEDMSLDMGIVELIPDVRIGDRAWVDQDGDGLQDPGEPGVPGVTVTLYDTQSGDVVGTTVTDADGNYLFDELYPGDYYVGFDLDSISENYGVVTPDAGDDALDSDADPETGLTPPTGILFTGEEDLSLDLGLYQIDDVAVGDQVWYDLNEDGLQDAGEPGVENIIVTLYDTATGQPVPGVPTQQTDSDGNYLFEDLPAGDYYVVFDLDSLPDGYGVTTPNAGDDAQDSDVNPADGSTGPTGPLAGDQSDTSLDMGIVALPPVTIGDTVWFDDNGDGIQDPTEEGVPGVTVYLYDETTGQPVLDENGEPLMQVTDATGEYLFTDVDPGQYYVLFELSTLPEGYVLSPADQEVSDNADSDAGSDGATPPTDVLTYGDTDRSLDMGIYKPVEVGDTVWLDDGNGQQDPGEEGIAGVGITLYNAEAGEVVGTTTTDENGNYLFENLPPGNYQVEFDLTDLPEGYMVVQPDQGGDDGADSDADPTTGRTPETGFLNSGDSDRSLDMGLVLPISIGDTVWFDDDLDGIQDGDELGVPGVIVMLYDVDGNPVATTTTGSNASELCDQHPLARAAAGSQHTANNPSAGNISLCGNYLFEGLMPGHYSIGFDLDTLPEGYVVTEANVGDDDGLDSDANPETGLTASTGFLPSGSVVDNLDMGIRIPDEDLVRIGGQLWEDADLDGEVDAGEQTWSNVPVVLYSQDDPNTPIATVLTDEDGNYLFENLPPGDYFVTIPADELPEGVLPPLYSSTDGSDDSRANSGLLDAGQQALDLNIQLNRPGSLSGEAWLDADGDGIQSADENGIDGVLVELYDATGEKVGEMETDENGSYLFDNLIPGEYRILCPGSKVYNLSPHLQGEDDSRDSDIDPATNQSGAKIIGPGQNLPNVDLGLFEQGSITNLFWNDLNGDGVQDADEPGLAGITVFLFNEAGEIVGETVTDSEGQYGFGNLASGAYYAAFEIPEDMLPVDALLREGTDLVRGPMITVDGSQNIAAENIGFTQVAALGNYVWLDTNKDGLVDPGEAGIADAIVRLLDEDGNLLEVTTTDSDGRFEFLVAPGNYQLQFLAKDGMQFTSLNQGDDSKDSDVDPDTGRTAMIFVAAGENSITNFAGMIVSPTAIQLMSLTATETASGVLVAWMTGSEFNTFGFQILRSRNGNLESAVEVTDEMVLARGGDGLYEFIDTTARAGEVYSYWLVEMQSDQTLYHYGPTQVVVEGLRPATNGFMLFLPLIEN